MPRWSTCDELPEDVWSELDQAVQQNAKTNVLVELAASHGHTISRSAMGRWAKGRRRYWTLIERERAVNGIGKEIEEELGPEDARKNRILIQMLRTQISSLVMDSGEKLDIATVALLTKTFKELMLAGKIDAERERMIRKEERENAAKEAETVLRNMGASADTIRNVKEQLLGLK